MWAIEARGRNAPGLYPWDGGAIDAETPLSEKAPAVLALTEQPGLIFIHGTGSHTLGGFGALPGSKAWADLQRQFGEHIYGFEHRTFSESPVDNALQLLAVLPRGPGPSWGSRPRVMVMGPRTTSRFSTV